jgi:hypothetical protein
MNDHQSVKEKIEASKDKDGKPIKFAPFYDYRKQ